MEASKKSELLQVVERNIAALVEQNRQADLKRTLEQRIADAITRFSGSMKFVYLHLGLYGWWISVNLGWLPGPRFDPSFVILAMEASVEAIFLSTFILITQNRMSLLAEKRAELDLQISLLAEHEITRLLKLVAQMADRMEIDAARSSEMAELQNDIQPQDILREIERRHPGAKPE
jgi:uncharacterized membrane protein